MSVILAGRFPTLERATQAAADLVRHSKKDRSDISIFYVNPAGQHDITAIGGDEIADSEAHKAHVGAIKGATAGGVLGLAVGIAAAVATPLAGAAVAAAAAGVGAYTGSLAGGLHEAAPDGVSTPVTRPAGVLVAVRIEEVISDELGQQEKLKEVGAALVASGAEDIEFATGTWANGDWVDFDPVSTPRYLRNGAL
jgi:hypothetical protein